MVGVLERETGAGRGKQLGIYLGRRHRFESQAYKQPVSDLGQNHLTSTPSSLKWKS